MAVTKLRDIRSRYVHVVTDTLTAPEQMADERKYQDDEVREICDPAVGGDRIGPPTAPVEGGLSLAELQEAGLEVGMKPERIAEAALAVDSRRGILPSGRYLGMPISVGRIVELPGPVTDDEWQLLVAEFREIFGSRGRIVSHGGVREWTNGNLHALVEPTATCHR